MVWIYFQESEAVPSPCPDTSAPLPTAKLSRLPKQCSSHEWPRVTSPRPRSGMMFQRCEAATYPTKSTSLQAGSLARTSALQAMEQAWQESEAAFFTKSQGCVASLSHDSSFWKTCQPSLLEAEPKWLEPLPRWGMIVDGALYPLRKLVPLTNESGGGYLPTLCARDWKDNGHSPSLKNRNTQSLALEIGGKINQEWAEYFMGYPIGWTEYEDWAMRGCLRKPAKRLKC